MGIAETSVIPVYAVIVAGSLIAVIDRIHIQERLSPPRLIREVYRFISAKALDIFTRL